MHKPAKLKPRLATNMTKIIPEPTSVYCELHPAASQIDVLALRKEFGMTQQQFADMLDVSLRTVQSWEEGTRRPSSPAKSLLKRVQDERHKVAA